MLGAPQNNGGMSHPLRWAYCIVLHGHLLLFSCLLVHSRWSGTDPPMRCLASSAWSPYGQLRRYTTILPAVQLHAWEHSICGAHFFWRTEGRRNESLILKKKNLYAPFKGHTIIIIIIIIIISIVLTVITTITYRYYTVL